MRSILLVSLVAVLVGATARVAAADPVVLAIDKGDIYVELGARDGVGAGTQLELLHEIRVRDPRSGKLLVDQFSLGALVVVKSGDRISVARAGEDLAPRVLAGDHVRIASETRKFVDPWLEQVNASKGERPPAPTVASAPATPSAPGGPDHAELVRMAWQDTLGKPPEQRIDRWLEYLRVDPQSPYRKHVQAEIQSLRTQIQQRDTALASARSVAVDRGPRIARLASALESKSTPLAIAPLERAVPGRPIALSFLVTQPGTFAQAWLYVRPRGEPGFRRVELRADGDAYLRGTIPAELVRGDTVEWYVETAATAADREASAVLGSRELPRTIRVEREVEEPPVAQGRSHIDAHADYVDFDGKIGKGFDQYYQAEIDFTYRFLHPIHAVRLGFGTLSGTGGPKDVIDSDPMGACLDGAGTFQCRKVNFSYVYLEFEHRIRQNVALMIRPQAGLLSSDTSAGTAAGRCSGKQIEGCEFFTGLGLRARLRLGSETGTNLVLGAGFTDEVGTLLEAAYHWLPTPIVPVQLTVQVTDMPVPENFGVRLIGDVGLRQLSWFYPSLRLSYQARDIDHAGVSGGVAMNFDW
ncbi:MAG TPA: hypothetical protein VFQ53_01620 [Kofleriaceae bacterium]|nr:hypothetical protein [Kofleriaceae bacterium]